MNKEELMFVITNRAITKSKGVKSFGDTLNSKGPNELRIVKIETKSGGWIVKDLTDKLSLSTVKALKKKHRIDIDVNATWHASLKVACDIFEQARKQKKSILYFVHGYNNDIKDVIKTAEAIESLHNVIVVPFSWPANGGGAISGLAAYLSDKSDARASSGALNRVVGKIGDYHRLLTESQKKKLQTAATNKHPNNPSAAAQLFTALMEKECPVKISLLCHSMGNYVFKHTFSTSQNTTSKLVFDNVCLVSADTNNANHQQWVNQLDVRKRVYVVINENDSALCASRIKPGDEQKVRLGHYLKKLNSPNATYIDVTDASDVGSEHSYFKGKSTMKNKDLSRLFSGMFGGASVDHLIDYHADNNTYTLMKAMNEDRE
jgi:esterase/lipase superfamily enzyme